MRSGYTGPAVTGKSSFPFTPAAADAVAAELPNATRETLVGYGPRPEFFTPTIRAFLLG